MVGKKNADRRMLNLLDFFALREPAGLLLLTGF